MSVEVKNIKISYDPFGYFNGTGYGSFDLIGTCDPNLSELQKFTNKIFDDEYNKLYDAYHTKNDDESSFDLGHFEINSSQYIKVVFIKENIKEITNIRLSVLKKTLNDIFANQFKEMGYKIIEYTTYRKFYTIRNETFENNSITLDDCIENIYNDSGNISFMVGQDKQIGDITIELF